MLLAVRNLWRLYEANQDRFVEVYESIRQEDDARVTALSPTCQLAEIRATLHYQRRLVSHYYAFLAGLYEFRIIPKHILYMYWTEGDLKIIPTILIPIEIGLSTKLLTFTAKHEAQHPVIRRLRKLYDDSRVVKAPQDTDMNSRVVGLRAAGTVFGLMCLGQLLRLVTRAEVLLAGHQVPLWLSAFAFVILGGLSLWM